MADQFYWLGSIGPFQYDDAVEVAGDPDLVYDGVDPPNQNGLICTGQIGIGSVPTLDPHVLRLVDVSVIVGDVVGPATSTDEAIARFDGATGKLLQDSNVLINDDGDITVPDDAWIGIGAAAERIIFDATGDISFMGCNVGIGTTSPTSPFHVVGLAVYANNAAAVVGGLTAGAFYRNGADPDLVCIVH